jgi:sulfur transfer protein SufE
MTIDEIIDNFAVLDDWDDRYRYVIELGRELTPRAPTPTRSRAAPARCGWRRR